MKNKITSLADRLPFWHFDQGLMVYADGSLGGAYRLTGFDIACLPGDEINNFNRQVENLLISADEGLRLQFFHRLSPDISHLIEEHRRISSEAPDIYQPVAEARQKFFEENAENNHYFVPEFYVFVRSKPFSYRKRAFWESPKKYEQISAEEYRGHREKFVRSLKQIESSLAHARLSPQRLSEEEWFRLDFQYLNLSRSEKLGIPPLRINENLFDPTLPSQLTLTDAEVHQDHLKVGDYLFRTITLKTLPEGTTHSSMVDALTTALPFHFWSSQTIQILDQAKERSRLELKRRIAHSMAAGSENVSDLESESKLTDIEGLLRELLEGSQRLVSMDFTIVIWADAKEQLEDRSDDVLKAFRSMGQSEGVVETLPGFDVFIESAPGVCAGFRHHKMKSSNAAHLLPLYSGWTGNSRPVCLIPNRENNLFSVDIFAKSLNAWNGLAFGQTGSGKSFTIAQLMLMFYGQKPTPRILWIDNGSSSKNLLEVLDGEFVDLNLESGIRLNVFDLPQGQTKPTPAKIKLILAVLELILKDPGARSLGKREKAMLEEAIFEAYKRCRDRTPFLSDLKKVLDSHSDQEMKKCGQILFSWTGETAYGRMLDGPTTIVLSKDLVTIEVFGLSDYPDLKDVLLLLLTSYIQEAAAADLARPYLLICDEAERFFKSGELSKQFIITCYRTWRKYNAGIWCLSQNYRDFLADPEIRDALIPNSTSIIILRQKKIDWDDFQKTFDFDDATVSAIKSLEVVKGAYSEFFFLQDENKTVLRLVPEPLSYWICTSDAADKARIQKMEQKYPELSKIEILKRLAFDEEKTLVDAA
ncbi:MAG: TraC family protein [Bdellovibrionales bacterium]|nr:TraC family protein [Bdellovibrionales bacterium]